jgi:hypothetical protein
MTKRFDTDAEVSALESIRDRIRRLREDLETLRDAEEANAATGEDCLAPTQDERAGSSKSYKRSE